MARNFVAKVCYQFNKPKVERSKKTYSRKTKHRDIKWRVSTNNRIKELEARIEQLLALETKEAEFVIDFNSLPVFSIERKVDKHTDQPCTIVGYEDGTPEKGEWTLYCSLDQHNKLARQFSEYLAKKVLD